MHNDENNTNTEPGPDVLEVRDANSPAASTGDAPGTPPGNLSRRKFLNQLSIALGGLGTVLVGAPVAGFIVGPLLKATPEVWRAIGTLDKFVTNETVEVSFEDASPLPWAGVTAKGAAWLRRVSDTQFIAFAVNCAHLGCPVSWLSGARLFLCPCHGGAYYEDGTVAAGPPQHPLYRYEVRVQNGQVELKATGTPIPVD